MENLNKLKIERWRSNDFCMKNVIKGQTKGEFLKIQNLLCNLR